MNTKNLEYIIQIAKERNLMKAAEKCYITQPALSHFITNTEEQLGYKLFFRERNNWTLTPAGEIFVEGARKMISIELDTTRRINQLLEVSKDTIRIGVGPDRGTQLLYRVSPKFRERFPEIRLSVVERRSIQLREMLHNGELDMIVCALSKKNEPYEEILFSAKDPILLMASLTAKLDCYLAKKDDLYPTVDLDTLADTPMILHRNGASMRTYVDYLLKKADINPNICMEFETTASIANYVIAGAGIAFLQSYHSEKYKEQSAFYYTNPSVSSRFCVVHRKGMVITKAEQFLADLFKQEMLS